MSERRLVTVSLAGEHVRLRPHVPGDAAQAFDLLAGNQAILRWLVWGGPATVEELAGFYRDGLREGAAGREYRLAIEGREPGCLVGSISLRFGPLGTTGDVGYWIGSPFQGRGLGREALALLARLAFRHLDASALEARVFVGNGASRRILERCGFSCVRTVPVRLTDTRGLVEQWHFVLLQGEWRRLAPSLEPSEERVEWEDAPPPTGLAPDSELGF